MNLLLFNSQFLSKKFLIIILSFKAEIKFEKNYTFF